MDLVQIISQVGFPIAVASYCLVVLNKTLAANTKATEALTQKLELFDKTLKIAEEAHVDGK